MKKFGQFIMPSSTCVEVNFPCPGCRNKIRELLQIKSAPHSDYETCCPKCSIGIDIIVTHNPGTGSVYIPALGKKQETVLALAI